MKRNLIRGFVGTDPFSKDGKPPKFNSSPLKNGWLEDYPFLLGWYIFRGELLNFQGCKILILMTCQGIYLVAAYNCRGVCEKSLPQKDPRMPELGHKPKLWPSLGFGVDHQETHPTRNRNVIHLFLPPLSLSILRVTGLMKCHWAYEMFAPNDGKCYECQDHL